MNRQVDNSDSMIDILKAAFYIKRLILTTILGKTNTRENIKYEEKSGQEDMACFVGN